MKKEEIKKKFLNKKHIEMFLLLDITFFINYLFDTYINDFRIVLILWIIFKVINFICYIYYFLFLLCVEIFRLFVKSGGGKSSIILRDSKLNKLFKVVEFFYPIR